MDAERRTDLIEGRNAVNEAMRAGRAIDKLFVSRGSNDPALGRIISRAKEQGIAVVTVDRRKLDEMSCTGSHQGVIAVAAARQYASVDDIFALAAQRGEDPFVIVCDEISDVHNLGAIIRSAEYAGAHGVIIPKRRSAGLTAVVDKTSAGAAEHLPVAKVANLPAALEELKAKFRKAMDSDLNTSMGVTVLYDVLKAKTTDATKLAALDALDSVLGLKLLEKAETLRAKQAAAPAAGGFTVVSESGEEDADVEAKIRARAEAKKAKNFAEADRIRDELKAAGIEVTDVPGGAKWKRI